MNQQVLTDERLQLATKKFTAAMKTHGRAGDEMMLLGLKQRLFVECDGSLSLSVNFQTKDASIEARPVPIDEALVMLFATDERNPELQIARELDAACELRRKQELARIASEKQAREQRFVDEAARRRWDAWNKQDRNARALRRLSLTTPSAGVAELADALATETTPSTPPDGWGA